MPPDACGPDAVLPLTRGNRASAASALACTAARSTPIACSSTAGIPSLSASRAVSRWIGSSCGLPSETARCCAALGPLGCEW